MLTVVLAMVLAMLGFTSPASAAPPPGGYEIGDENVSMTSEHGVTVGWSLGEVRNAGSPNVSVASEPTDEGTVRTLITIDGQNAPRRYVFPVDMPSGGALEPQPDGSVNIQVDGKPVGTFIAPWAKDANGADLATRYEIAGRNLIQVVEFDRNTAFPVTADPVFTWGIVTGHIYFNWEETTLFAAAGGAGEAALPFIIALIPPPAGPWIAANTATVAVWAQAAVLQEKCLYLKYGFTGQVFPPSLGVVPGHHDGEYCTGRPSYPN